MPTATFEDVDRYADRLAEMRATLASLAEEGERLLGRMESVELQAIGDCLDDFILNAGLARYRILEDGG